MSTVQTTNAPGTDNTSGSIPITLVQYSQSYSVSRNPFGISSILPLITLCFIGLEFGILANLDSIRLLGVFILACTGILLIPATTLRGRFEIDEKGMVFRHGSHSVTASWENIVGLVYKPDSGVCIAMKNATQTKSDLKLAGGFRAKAGEALIPLRLFGDRRFAILYEIRDRLPSSAWLPALQEAKPPTPKRVLWVYTLTTAVGVASILAVGLTYLNR